MVAKRLNRSHLNNIDMVEKLRILRDLLKDEELRKVLKDLLLSEENQRKLEISTNDRPAEDRRVGGSNPPRPIFIRITDFDLNEFREWLSKNYPSRTSHYKKLMVL